MYYNTRSSIAETYLQFAGMLNCKSMTTELYKFSNSIAINEVKVLANFNLEEYIVINPNASDLRVERQWSKENFIELIKQISLCQPSKLILLIGSKSESEYIDGIISEIPKSANIVSVAGKTNIAELISIIKNAQILITNDTGPMHIAFAVETPTIALFGPCAPQQYGIGKNCIVVYQNLYCSPCVHEFVTPPCKGNNYCMKSIDVPSVFNLFVEFFEVKMNLNKGVRDKIMFQFNDFTIGTVNRK
jgi:ADP-heptose:LPS heptosyltransferase